MVYSWYTKSLVQSIEGYHGSTKGFLGVLHHTWPWLHIHFTGQYYAYKDLLKKVFLF